MSIAAPNTVPRPAVIVDAGVGNLGNLARAVAAVGGIPRVTSDPREIAGARTLLLPGVGAFRPPRERIRGQVESALRDAIAEGARLLGICVGYQLLFEAGEEYGVTDGLALLPGRVRRLPAESVTLPHIGWNPLHSLREHPLLDGLSDGTFVYFVHSFAPAEVDPELVLARATHGTEFPAIVARGRVAGTQFHPEKSGPQGLRLLRNFLTSEEL